MRDQAGEVADTYSGFGAKNAKDRTTPQLGNREYRLTYEIRDIQMLYT